MMPSLPSLNLSSSSSAKAGDIVAPSTVNFGGFGIGGGAGGALGGQWVPLVVVAAVVVFVMRRKQ